MENEATITDLIKKLDNTNLDLQERMDSAMTLAKMLSNEKTKEPVISSLQKALSEHNLKDSVPLVFGYAAKEGVDISRLIPDLINFLGDKDARNNAAFALGQAANQGADISKAIPALVSVLTDKYALTRKNAAFALAAVAYNGADISVSITTLSTLLSDDNPDIRYNALAALSGAAQNKADISESLISCVKLFSFSDNDQQIIDMANQVLNYVLENNNFSRFVAELGELLSNQNQKVREWSSYALTLAARKKYDMQSAVPFFSKGLSDLSPVVKANIVGAIGISNVYKTASVSTLIAPILRLGLINDPQIGKFALNFLLDYGSNKQGAEYILDMIRSYGAYMDKEGPLIKELIKKCEEQVNAAKSV